MHCFKRFQISNIWRPLLVIFINSLHLKTTADAFNIMEKDAPVFTGGNLRDSFFGYTVGIHSDDDSNKWIFVGAPRDNDTTLRGIDRPGVLYKCQINTTSCQSITVDANTSPENITVAGKFRSFNPGKNSQWLGGALDINKGNIFVCAHRWYDQYNPFTNVKHFYQNGICYESAASKSNTWGKYPLLTPEGQNMGNKTHASGLYYPWGFGSLGISVHFIGTEYADVLIGTPGVDSWTGGFVRLRQDDPFYSENKMLPSSTSELIGYAMSSGKYFGGKEIYFAAGGPRLNLTGKVLLFNMTDTSYDVNQPFLTLNGDENGQTSQIGSYFGSSLTSADVNKDNFDDLLVGAPMFASKNAYGLEEGRVFVYLGSPDVGLFKRQMSLLKGSDVPRARFGTAITSLGDINKDSYADIAIGAPFEDEGVGAVYIYNGYTDGLWNTFTQRISGKVIQPELKGFGISFSRAQDTNDDKMIDVAVGAFLSGNVVLLQSQPVIQLEGEIELSYGQISSVLDLSRLKNCTINRSRLYSCFEFEIKFKFKVSQVIQTIVLNITASVDTLKERHRFSFLQNNKETLEATFSISVEQGTNFARTPEVMVLVKSTSDLVTPIRFFTKYDLQNYTLFKLPQRSLQPVLNIFDGAQAKEPTKTITKEIEFQKDCLNNDCNTDLHLSVKADVNNDFEVFIDELELLKLNVSITKTGDPAYGTGLTIIFPKSFKYKKVEKIKGDTDIQCSFKTEELKTNGLDAFFSRSRNASATNETVLVCSYGNPMRKDDGVEFQVVLVPSVYTETSFHFYFNATSQSKEKILADNTVKISLFGKKKLATTFKGISRPDSVSTGAGRNMYEVKHLFDLHNQGPSSLPEAVMYLKYPYVTINEKAYLRLLGKPNITYTSGSSVSCEETSMTSGIKTTTGQIHENNDIKHSDCSIDNCSAYKCLIKNIPPRTSAVVNLTFEINIELIKVLHQNKSFSSTATVTIQNSTTLVLNTLQHTTEIRTRLVQISPPPEPVALWIILVSVLAGILIIVILILILWKCGFFKRKKLEEMKQRKSEEAKILVNDIEEINQETKDQVNMAEMEQGEGDEAKITEEDVEVNSQETNDERKDKVKEAKHADV